MNHLFKFIFSSLFVFSALFSQSAYDAVRIVQDETGFGARALALGGAYSGLANDYTAIYWNPAGLAALKDSEFYSGISHINFSNSATFAQNTFSESNGYTHLNSFGIALPLATTQGSLVLALGYNRVKDFDQNLTFNGFNTNANSLSFQIEDVDYPFNENVQQEETVTDEGGLGQWNFGFGVALSPKFNAGVTASFWNGESDYRFIFRQDDVNDNYNQFPADFKSYILTRNLISDYSAVSLKLGGIFDLTDQLTLGGTVGLPVTFNVEETFTQEDIVTFDDDFEDILSDAPAVFEYQVKTPIYFDGGFSFKNKLLTLALSARYRDWSQTQFKADGDGFDLDGAELLAENQTIKTNYQATTELRMGGELNLENFNSVLRGGYALYPSPLKNADSDLDKTVLSGGVGFKLDEFVTIDVTALQSSWKQTSEDEFTPGGTLEDITLTKIILGFTYRF